jgi:hypothetical protein
LDRRFNFNVKCSEEEKLPPLPGIENQSSRQPNCNVADILTELSQAALNGVIACDAIRSRHIKLEHPMKRGL